MISLSHIYKAFGDQVIFRDLSLDISPGDRLCIVGGSGVGKSVMLKLIMGFETPDQGTVSLEGRNTALFTKKDWNEAMRSFGLVFQHAALFDSLNVLENVGMRFLEDKTLSPQDIREAVVGALEKVHLKEDILEKYPAELSGGMQKRVGIARAIIHKPRYLFYDEPTTGLDPVRAAVVDELIAELAEDAERCTVVVTHDLQTVKRIANRVVMLQAGKICFEGNMTEFFESEKAEVKAFLKRES